MISEKPLTATELNARMEEYWEQVRHGCQHADEMFLWPVADALAKILAIELPPIIPPKREKP